MLRELTVMLAHIISGKKRVALIVFAILLLSSMLSLTALTNIKSALNIFDVFYPAGSDSTVIIASSRAISPLTSLVDAEELRQRLSSVYGVELHSVFVTLGIVDGRPAIVYEISGGDEGCAYPDEELAEYSRKAWNGYIPIYSVFTKQTLFLKVCGVGDSPGVGVSHNTIARIRGVSPRYYSFALIEVLDRGALEGVYRTLVPEVNVEPSTLEKLLERATAVAIRVGRDTAITQVENPTQIFLERLGIHRDYVISFAYFTALTTILCLPLLGLGIVEFLKRDIEVYAHIICVSRISVILTLLLLTALASTLSNAVAWLLVLRGAGPRIDFLGYTPQPNLDIRDLATVTVAQLALCSIGIIARMRGFEA